MPDLPSEPSLQQLRYQARDLQRAEQLVALLEPLTAPEEP